MKKLWKKTRWSVLIVVTFLGGAISGSIYSNKEEGKNPDLGVILTTPVTGVDSGKILKADSIK